MAKSGTLQKRNNEARERVHELFVQLKGVKIAEQVYERLLTMADRRRISEPDFYNRHVVDNWVKLRKISQDKAALEIARRLEMLSQSDYLWLLREIGEKGPAEGVVDYPRWDRDQRKLFLKGKAIRTVRSLTIATHVVKILDAFENQGWPSRIDDPLEIQANISFQKLSPDKQRLREAVANLNRGLKGIHFYSDGEGEGIVWNTL